MYVLVKFEWRSGRLIGGGCSIGLLCVFLVLVPDCWFVFLPPRFLEWGFFLVAPFPDHCLLLPLPMPFAALAGIST